MRKQVKGEKKGPERMHKKKGKGGTRTGGMILAWEARMESARWGAEIQPGRKY